MNQGQVLDILREGLMIAFKLSAPILIASIAIGLVIAIFQAAPQIHEQTLTFVPKLLGIALLLLLLGSWMATTMIDFVKNIFSIMANL